MGNYQKYLTNLYQTFTDIKALKVMNVYQILIIYLIPEKNNGQKVCLIVNLKRLVAFIIPNFPFYFVYVWWSSSATLLAPPLSCVSFRQTCLCKLEHKCQKGKRKRCQGLHKKRLKHSRHFRR